jgi:hypothetical protein
MDRIAHDATVQANAATDDYLADLRSAQDEATRRADLDEAVRIRDESQRIKQKKPAPTEGRADANPRQALASRLSGTKWEDRPGLFVTLDPDGTITRTDDKSGRWAVIGDHAIILTFSDGFVDLWQIDQQLGSFSAVNATFSKNPWKGKRAR